MTRDQFLTPPQIAKQLRISEAVVLAAIRRGDLEAANFSNGQRPRWKVSPANLDAWIRRHSNRKPPLKGPRRPFPLPVKEYV
jgi:hypothetical protein